MDNEAEGNKANEGALTSSAQEAIGDAAKANVNAALEVAKSAVGSFVGALTGEQRKPRTAKRSSTGAASTQRKAKRSAGRKRSPVAAGRKATRKSPARQRSGTRRTGSAATTRRSGKKAATARTARKSPQAKRRTSKARTSKLVDVPLNGAPAESRKEQLPRARLPTISPGKCRKRTVLHRTCSSTICCSISSRSAISLLSAVSALGSAPRTTASCHS
jgi:hypothetical protein